MDFRALFRKALGPDYPDTVPEQDRLLVRRASLFMWIGVAAGVLSGMLAVAMGQLIWISAIFLSVGMFAAWLFMTRTPPRPVLGSQLGLWVGLGGTTLSALLSVTTETPSLVSMAFCAGLPVAAAYLLGTRDTIRWTIHCEVAIVICAAAMIALDPSGRNPEELGMAAMILMVVVLMVAAFAAAGRRLTDEQITAIDEARHELANMNASLETTVTERTAEIVAQRDELASSNARLESALEDAQAASRAKGLFVANMSHELRTPLNGVLGVADLLGDTDLSADQLSLLRSLQDSGRSLLDTLGSILDFATVESGGIDLTPHPCDPAEVVYRAVDDYSHAATAAGVDLAVALDSRLPDTITVDAVQLGRAIERLVANAVKFCTAGHIMVAAWGEPVAEDDGRFTFCVQVADTGPGIAPEKLDHLWDAFAPGDDSSQKAHAGIGLGLTLVHQVTTLMGGRVDVSSCPGEGARFTVRIPVDGAMRAPRPASAELGRIAVIAGPATRWPVALALVAAGAEVTVREPGDELGAADVVIVDRAWDAAATLVLPGGIRTVEVGGLDGVRRPVRAPSLVAAVAAAVPQPVRLDAVADAPDVAGATLSFETDADTTVRAEPRRLVLIVEDNPVNRKVLTKMVATLGYETMCAENGQLGADAYAAHADELAAVLMDCQMPVLDGFGATREIRNHELGTGRRCPIIAVTANALEGDREKCLAAGMDDFLAKPVDRARLGATLGEWAPAPVRS